MFRFTSPLLNVIVVGNVRMNQETGDLVGSIASGGVLFWACDGLYSVLLV